MTIVDLSKFQPSNKIDWATFSKNVELLICRIQYGSSSPDSEYKNHVANAKKYGIPFNSYAFPAFISVNDARVESRDAVSRQDADSKVLWIDIESEYNADKSPRGITKLSQSVRLEGIKAYVDELRKNGVQKVGAYIAHNVYKAWGIDSIVGIFDCIWIPRYGTNNGTQQVKPDFPCDLWQYSSVARVPGYNGNLDVSILMGTKPLEYFTDKSQQVSPTPTQNDTNSIQPQFCTKQAILQTLRCDGHTDIRVAPNHASAFVRDTQPGEVFHVFDKVIDAQGHCWDNLGGANWVDEKSGIFFWLDNPNLKQPAAPQTQYYVIAKGDTLGKIAAKFGTSISQLQNWNGIKNPNIINAGVKIRVK